MESYKFSIDNNPYEVKIISIEENSARVSVNGSEYHVDIAGLPALTFPSSVPAMRAPMQTTALPKPAPRPLPKPAPVKSDIPAMKPMKEEKKAPEPVKKEQPAAVKAGANSIVAPMPGSVFKILVGEGETVRSGDIVVTIEAMKMENQIRATMDGKVAKVHVKEGDVVAEGAPLISLG